MDAVVTAGGRADWVVEQQGTPVKALLRLGGTTLLARTLSAIRGCPAVEQICVVGPQEAETEARQHGADVFLLEADTGIENLMLGINALARCDRVLVSASDLPLVLPEDIGQVIDLTSPNAAVSYTVFTKREWESAFPDHHNMFVRLADGEFTGGCVFVQGVDALRRLEPILHTAFSERKSRSGMARLLGLRALVRFSLGRYIHPALGPTSEQLRRRAEAVIGAPCALVRGCSPRIAADVDTEKDWQSVTSYAG